MRWVSKSRVMCLTLGEMYEPGPDARPTHEDQEGRPVTMKNDPPQVFGDDTRDYPVYPGPVAGQDDGDFPAFRDWAGRGERVEPLAPDGEYPQPSFTGYEPASNEPVHPLRDRPARPGYPQGPGYPLDASFGRNAAPVPAMEPLPGLEDQVAMSAPVLLPPRGTPDMVPPWPAMAPGPVPAEAAAPLRSEERRVGKEC